MQMNETLESSRFSKQVSSISSVPGYSGAPRRPSSPPRPEVVPPLVIHSLAKPKPFALRLGPLLG
jgi:hypothetical protein